MDKRDRAFLEDMKSFICLNRVTTAFTFMQVGASPQSISDMTFRNLLHDLPEPLLSELSRESTGRIQVIVTAKIFAELYAAYEDLGAFGSAIKHRSSEGIFSKYLNSKTWHVRQFFDDLKITFQDQPKTSLDLLLNLPSLAELDGHIPSDMFNNLSSYYQNVTPYLYEVAVNYRKQRYEVRSISSDGSSLSEQRNTIQIITNLLAPEGAPPKSPIHTDAFNKVKHQFLVTSNVSAYDIGDGRIVEFSSLSREPEFIQNLIKSIVVTARIMCDFAGILLLLDNAKIEL